MEENTPRTLFFIYLSYSNFLLNHIEKRITNSLFISKIQNLNTFKTFLLQQFPEEYTEEIKLQEYLIFYAGTRFIGKKEIDFICKELNINFKEGKKLEQKIINSDAKREPNKEIPSKYYQKPKSNLVRITTTYKNTEF